MIQFVGQAFVVVSALLAIAGLVVYQALSRWWESPYGRHFFSFQAVLAACLSLWASRLFFPDGDWFQVARLVAFAGVPVVLAWRIVVIIRAWREERSIRMEERQ